MMRSFLVTVLLVTTVAATAAAGTIEGKVSTGKVCRLCGHHPGQNLPGTLAAAGHQPKGLDV